MNKFHLAVRLILVGLSLFFFGYGIVTLYSAISTQKTSSVVSEVKPPILIEPNDEAETLYLKGKQYAEKRHKEVERDIEWFEKTAGQGDIYAAYHLGEMYRYGETEDYVKAAKFYTIAAEHGYAPAQRILGWQYQKGQGVKQNYELAMKLYLTAAQQGCSMAMYNVGVLYAEGLGVERSGINAEEWYEKAFRIDGNMYAAYALGEMYQQGVLVKQDYYKAVQFYTVPASRGYYDSLTKLAWFYHHGIGVTQDRQKAVLLYRKSAELENEEAEQMLRQFYPEAVQEEGYSTDWQELDWLREERESVIKGQYKQQKLILVKRENPVINYTDEEKTQPVPTHDDIEKLFIYMESAEYPDKYQDAYYDELLRNAVEQACITADTGKMKAMEIVWLLERHNRITRPDVQRIENELSTDMGFERFCQREGR